jgi:hypothetical protein
VGSLKDLFDSSFEHEIGLTIAKILHARDELDHQSLLEKVRTKPGLFNAYFDLIYEALPSDEFQVHFTKYEVNSQTKNVMLQLLRRKNFSFDVHDKLEKFLRLNDNEINLFMANELCARDDLTGSFLLAIQNLNRQEREFDIGTFCRILWRLNVQHFELENFVERVLYRLNATEILPFLDTFPFLAVTDVKDL